MAKWLHSGRRRDICVLLYDSGEIRAQSLKTRIESAYDERIDPKSFYGTLSALVESGLVERRIEGITEMYSLSPTGEQKLVAHLEWIAKHVDGFGCDSTDY